MRHLYKMLAVVMLLLNVSAANAQYATGLALTGSTVYPFLGLESVAGPRLPYNESEALIGQVVYVTDFKGSPLACDSIAEDLTGKIAIIDRGTCGFTVKALNAQKKGAIAVIIANNASAFGFPGGADPLVKIPYTMVSKNDGDSLKAKLATGNMFAQLWHPNAYGSDAQPVVAGQKYFKDNIYDHPFKGVPGLFPDAGGIADTLKQSAFFVYKPTQSGKVDVSSCLGLGNTDVAVYEATPGNVIFYDLRASKYTKVAGNGSSCGKDLTDANKEAAAVSAVPVTAGNWYFIEWTTKDSEDSFFFDLKFTKRDSVNVTFRVDMKSEASVDLAGVHIAGNFQGWNPAATKMDNVAGTKIYEKTIRVASDATLLYKFVNGKAWGKDESVANNAPCAAGADGNRKFVTKTEDIVLNTPCFKSCEVCIDPKPDFVCDPQAIVCDPFKAYPNGNLLNGTAAHWTTWDDAPIANASPAFVSSEQFASDTKAMLVSGAITPGQDVVFKTTNLNNGHYKVSWKMYIPKTGTGATARKHAYYNLQHDLTGSHVFSTETSYLSNGTFRYNLGTVIVGAGTWEADKWFDVEHDIDIDKDTIIATVGTNKFGWKWSRTTAAAVFNKQLAGVNFYADSSFSKYFVDDIQLIKFPDPKAKVTFSVDMKNETVDAKGVTVAGNFQKAAGFPADWTPGTVKLTNKAGTTVWETTVELPIGSYEFKFVNGDSWNNKEEKMTGKACNSNDNRAFEVASLDAKTIGTFCYNSCYNCSQKEVTFIIDMSKETSVFSKGVSIAGDFQKAAGYPADWTPGVIYATKATGRIYVAKVGIPAGTYAYKFVNGDAWGKDEAVSNTAACAAGKDGNRKLVVGTVDMKLDTVCFKHCVICSKVVSTNDAKFDAAMELYPNPTNDIVNLEYNFTENVSLNVRIVNMMGQVVYTAEIPEINAGTAVLDVHNLTSGTYLMQITDEKNRQTVKRFVVEK